MRTYFYLAWIVGSLLFLAAFAAIALSDAVRKMDDVLTRIESTPAYRKEVRHARTGVRGGLPRGPEHWRFWRVRQAQRLLALSLLAGSQMFMVPLTKACVRTFQCRRVTAEEADRMGVPPHHLALLPELGCYEGLHLLLAVLVAVLFPVYLWIAQPYSLINGSTTVTRKHLIRPCKWPKVLARELGLLHLGPVHMTSRGAFWTMVTENFTKVACPCLHCSLHFAPRWQAGGICAVNAAALAVFLRFPAFRSASMNAYFLSFKVATVYAYAVALFSELLADPESPLPAVAWNAGLLLLAGAAARRFYRCAEREARQEELGHLQKVFRPATAACDGPEPEQPDQGPPEGGEEKVPAPRAPVRRRVFRPPEPEGPGPRSPGFDAGEGLGLRPLGRGGGEGGAAPEELQIEG